MGRKSHIAFLKEFKKKVSRDLIIREMYLFGSRAKGKPRRWSDFDLVIVSPHFKRKKSFKRARKLYEHWDLDYPVDFLCYTPKEFNKLKKQITIVREAVREGIKI